MVMTGWGMVNMALFYPQEIPKRQRWGFDRFWRVWSSRVWLLGNSPIFSMVCLAIFPMNTAIFTMGHFWVPSGKRLHSYGKSPFSMGKSTIFMVIFNSYVSLPEVYISIPWIGPFANSKSQGSLEEHLRLGAP